MGCLKTFAPQKGDLERAVRFFERALHVNPNLVSIAAALLHLRELLRQRRRDTT